MQAIPAPFRQMKAGHIDNRWITTAENPDELVNLILNSDMLLISNHIDASRHKRVSITIFNVMTSSCRLAAGTHGGFSCTIWSVPLHWLVIGFCAFDKLFCNRNSIRAYHNPTETARTFAPGCARRSFVFGLLSARSEVRAF